MWKWFRENPIKTKAGLCVLIDVALVGSVMWALPPWTLFWFAGVAAGAAIMLWIMWGW